ncbi:hypothetical protein LCGC14_1435020 [marine sediment metagenome]|uniref:Uncharacterized protein n=1 Tax=marine sediment metagenome TaxID=412755 RepID=A0A0F9JME8_9ZZZZ
MTWLAVTPQAVVHAHLEMLERLRAEESMTTATATAIGSRGLKPGEWMTRQWRKWRQSASVKQYAVKATATDLRGVGVGVHVVKKKATND